MLIDAEIFTAEELQRNGINPIFVTGDSLRVLRKIPDNSIDCCVTSPPYWRKRVYENGGIGLEETVEDYVNNLCLILDEVYRVLKPQGSLWLNIGDSYQHKSLLNIPWRVAIKLGEKGWIQRNTVIWNKVKGAPDNSKDKLRNIYEPIFHFVKSRKYYYDVDSVRNKPQTATVKAGKVVSSTGVTGVSYRRKIELSTALSEAQKSNAIKALDSILKEVEEGKIYDFRMIIKGITRATHSDGEMLSGRAKELNSNGFYFIRCNPKGSKPSDLWDIIPEDEQGRSDHYAPYPEDICRLPIILTCPPEGIVLDPFSGTGTTCLVAKKLNRKSLGIDISRDYNERAEDRVVTLTGALI